MESVKSALFLYLHGTDADFIFPAYTVLLLIEWVVGRRARASFRDIAFNYAYLVIVLGILLFLRPFAAQAAAAIARPFGGPYFDLTFGAHGEILRNVLAIGISILVYDFFYYWHHRWQHKRASVWTTHKLHHSDENLGITSAYKHHWTDDALRTFTILLPMAILFKFDPVTIFWVAYAVSLQGLLIHMNIELDWGWLGYITPSPNMHRVHHSTLEEHRDKNFAAVFSFWDVLFGTYHPGAKVAPPTGLDTGEKFETMWRAHTYPFVEWWNMARRKIRPTDAGLAKRG